MFMMLIHESHVFEPRNFETKFEVCDPRTFFCLLVVCVCVCVCVRVLPILAICRALKSARLLRQ